MFKKILTLTMSLTLFLSCATCGSGLYTAKVMNDEGSTQAVTLDSLKSQIQNVTPITDYAGNASIDQMDTVTFGIDEQSRPIEWIVLEKSNNKALLISKYTLDIEKYNDEHINITWENCTMRKWLNLEYINMIFSKKEQDSILITDVINTDNTKYGTKGGNNTQDKLFLLSIDEVNKYFSISQRETTNKNNKHRDAWWLRSPGIYQTIAASVGGSSDDQYFGHSVDILLGVRPALWVAY